MEILTIFIPGVIVIGIGYWIFLSLQEKASGFKVNLDEHRRVKKMERILSSFDEDPHGQGASGSNGLGIAIFVVGIVVIILLIFLLMK